MGLFGIRARFSSAKLLEALPGGKGEMSQCAIWHARCTYGGIGRRPRRLVTGKKGAKRRRRDHNRSPKMTVGSGCSQPFGVSSPTAKSPEESSQKCAAGRDAVQIARLQELVSKSRITSHPVPQHEFDCLGAYGDGASATPLC